MAKKKGLKAKVKQEEVKEPELPAEVVEQKEAKEVVQEAPLAPKSVANGPKWVKVTLEELMKIQSEKRLAGWNPATSEALINEEE